MIRGTDFTPPLAATGWAVYRIVPSVFPFVSIFDRIADPADLEAIFLIEAMTNDRLRQEAGDISLVPVEDRISGAGATPIMAAFTHLNPEGGRFTDASCGAYYAATGIDTAIAETRYHREEFLARTNEAAIDIDMRVYLARLDGELHDVRGGQPEAIYAPDDYRAGQVFARALREAGSNGLIYDSVRATNGTCVAVFRPRLLSGCRQERYLSYRWDGRKISEIYEKRAYYAER